MIDRELKTAEYMLMLQATKRGAFFEKDTDAYDRIDNLINKRTEICKKMQMCIIESDEFISYQILFSEINHEIKFILALV